MKYILYIFACILLFLFLNSFSFFKNAYVYQNNTANSFEWQKSVDIYFPNQKMNTLLADEKGVCDEVFPIARNVPNAETLAPGAITELIFGPTADEKRNGYYSEIKSDLLIEKFEIRDKTAYVLFDKSISVSSKDRCRQKTAHTQIIKTLKNLPDIDEVVVGE